jgi:hypothetical protein
MTFDKDTVREILLRIEASSDPRGWIDIDIPGRSETEVSYHVQILDEAGFIEAENLSDMQNYTWKAKRLTYQGHELLDSIRDPEVWSKTREGASKVGGLALDVLMSLGKAYAKQILREKLGIVLP